MRKLDEKKMMAAFDKKGAFPGAECGTENCTGVARWIPISEGNAGKRIYRCTDCCDEMDSLSSSTSSDV